MSRDNNTLLIYNQQKLENKTTTIEEFSLVFHVRLEVIMQFDMGKLRSFRYKEINFVVKFTTG